MDETQRPGFLRQTGVGLAKGISIGLVIAIVGVVVIQALAG